MAQSNALSPDTDGSRAHHEMPDSAPQASTFSLVCEAIMVIVAKAAAKRRALTRVEMQAFADTVNRWMDLIDQGEMEAGPVFRHELAGALTVLEVVLGHEPSLTGELVFTRDEVLM